MSDLFIVFASIAIYLLPAIVAGSRGHQNTAAILVTTLFLGWTGIGWIVALIWSFTQVIKQEARA